MAVALKKRLSESFERTEKRKFKTYSWTETDKKGKGKIL